MTRMQATVVTVLGCLAVICCGLLIHRSMPKGGHRAKTILCTTFPMWLLTRNVVGDTPGFSVELLLPAEAGCPHDYVLTPEDLRKIGRADVLVINGLGLDDFAMDAVKRVKPTCAVLDSSKAGGALLPETDHDSHAGRMNPHLFAGPRESVRLAEGIATMLAARFMEHASLFQTNSADYGDKMGNAGDMLVHAVASLANKRVMAQHGIFDYMARDCGLTVDAHLQSHPGQDPSAAELLKLTRSVRALGTAAVLAEPQYSDGAARTVAREAGVPCILLDPCATGPANADADYMVATVRANAAALQRALGK